MAFDVPPSHQTGRVGAREIELVFERLGIGVDRITEHDFGLDVYLHVRNDAGIDLGISATAQLKSGASWFSEPARDSDGTVTGWWFRSDEHHLEYWLRLTQPVLLVLYDPSESCAYWVRVTDERAERTGSGWRILVPVLNQLGVARREELLNDLTAFTRPALAFEGSSWRVARPTDPGDANWRYALCAPRLVAPHQNVGTHDAIGPMAAAALLVQGRFRDFDEFAAHHRSIPSLDEAVNHKKWAWRFLHALGGWLCRNDSEPLTSLSSTGQPGGNRAAAAVAAAFALRLSVSAAQAIEWLDQHAPRRGLLPLDRAWLVVHRASMHWDTGDDTAARKRAGEAVAILKGLNDPMASALRGAATSHW